MEERTCEMVKSVDRLRMLGNRPRRGYEGRGSHRLTGPPFHHATIHHQLLTFTDVISTDSDGGPAEAISPACACVCVCVCASRQQLLNLTTFDLGWRFGVAVASFVA